MMQVSLQTTPGSCSLLSPAGTSDIQLLSISQDSKSLLPTLIPAPGKILFVIYNCPLPSKEDGAQRLSKGSWERVCKIGSKAGKGLIALQKEREIYRGWWEQRLKLPGKGQERGWGVGVGGEGYGEEHGGVGGRVGCLWLSGNLQGEWRC